MTTTETHQIRITKSGKIKHWVSFALDHFQKEENHGIALELHTLPPSPSPSPTSTTANKTTTEGEKAEEKEESTAIPSCTMLIPRLISVVEIIKREYIKTLEQNHSTRMHGLHQYNHFVSVSHSSTSTVEEVQTEEERAARIAEALGGTHYPKQKQTSYMKITLSLTELPPHLLLLQPGTTYQPPILRKLSKSAKSRAKKRIRKAEADADS